MLGVANAGDRSAPASPAERQLVLRELSAILASPHFRNSKRYPALLKYIVEKTLNGEAAELKERLLGVVVFDRRPEYDTNADPVVRVSAGEVRKRIAQYYQETGEDSPVQISLPLGCYVPEFSFRDNGANGLPEWKPSAAVESAPVSIDQEVGNEGAEPPIALFSATRPIGRRYAFATLAVTLLVTFLGILALHRISMTRSQDALWGPVLQTPGRVLIVVGRGHPELTTPDSPQTSLVDHMLGPYDHISLFSAIAISSISGELQTRGRTYEIKDEQATSLQDLQGRPVVLIGAMNNLWTLRLTQRLRYRFAKDPLPHIEDSQYPGSLAWSLDHSKPFDTITTDYAILARYHDEATNSTVLVAAGLGPWANEAASRFAASPTALERLNKALPSGWKSKNIEVVLKTEVIEQEPGTASIVAAQVW